MSDTKIRRIVIELRGASPSAIALSEAIHLANALDAELNGLFISDAELQTISRLSVARTLTTTGQKVAQSAANKLERDIYLTSRSMERQFDQMATQAKLKHKFKSVQNQPIEAVLSDCSDNDDCASILVLSETLALKHLDEIDELMTSTSGLRGILMVGAGAEQRVGPAIIAPETEPQVETMIEYGRALANADQPIILFHASDDEDVLQRRAEYLHQSIKPDPRIKLLSAHLPTSQPAVSAEAIRRLNGGLVIAEYGGELVAGKGELMALATALACPLLIIR